MRVNRRGIELVVLAAIVLGHAPVHAQEPEPQTEPQPEPQPEPPVPAVEEPAPEPPPPPPPPAPAVRKVARFGSAGVVMVSSNAAIGVGGASFDDSKAEYFSATFAPGLDYFIVRHVSLGLDLGITYTNDRGYAADSSLVRTEATTLSGGVRLGVDLPLGRLFSFYPRLTGGLERWHREDTVVEGRSIAPQVNATGIPSSSSEGPWVTVFTPLLVHPTAHFFAGAGPTFFHSFARVQGGPEIGGERTTWGGQLVFGAWWGGEADTDEPAEEASHAREPAFGETGEVVLTGELDVHGGHATYAGTGSSATGITIAPGFDYFVATHVSLGLAATFAYYESVGMRPDGTRAEVSSKGGGLAPRIGVDLPIVKGLSFYPRATLAFGGRSVKTHAGQDGYEYSETFTTGSVFAPLLVHPASHAFLGLGPYVSRDFTRKLEGGAAENPGTSYGASLLVGGWL